MQTNDFFESSKVRFSTVDRGLFHAPTELGQTRRLTPEGYLVCEGVCIARTGEQLYHESELRNIKPDARGQVRVTRLPEEVFNPKTIASFEGKSVTVEHPNEFVNPTNVHQHEIGTIHNVRRGDGIENDMLVADLLIKDAHAIAYVNKYKPQVSCGYDAEYDQDEPGHAFQREITGNHLALVDRGRAGPRCAIRDHRPNLFFKTLGEHAMATKPTFKSRFMDQMNKLRAAYIAKDTAKFEEVLASSTMDEEPDEEEMMDRMVDAVIDRLDKRAADKAAKDAEEEEKRKKMELDAAAKAKDTVIGPETTAAPDVGKLWTGDALRAILARAEILSPGISMPTQDSIDESGKAVIALMRKSLATADSTDKGRAAIQAMLIPGMTLDAQTKTVAGLSAIFNASAELMRQQNNAKPTSFKPGTKDNSFKSGASIADIQKMNDEFWNKKQA